MPGLLPHVDPDGLLEYSVVYTDRSLNHMSQRYGDVVRDISRILKSVYQAHATIIVPGGGTFGMEAVARQFAVQRRCMVIRNGWFSYRWTQIFEQCRIPADSIVLQACRDSDAIDAPFSPAPIEVVCDEIARYRPDLVFAPHVETSSGILLPDEYLQGVAEAVHDVGGLFVLDCVASGAIWVDMQQNGVDILISAPQKGWSGPPAAALVVLNETALQRLESTESNSFAVDLKKWWQIMQSFEQGGHAYHATPPTDALAVVASVMQEAEAFGLEKLRQSQWSLGRRVRALLAESSFPSVAAVGFQAPSVVVSYTSDAEISSGKKFAAQGLQIAAGVPLQCNEGPDFRTFRIGLFGLEKLYNIERSVQTLETALAQMR